MGNKTNTDITFEPLKELSEFEIYDQDHPQVWEAFERFTFKAIKKGFKNYGARSIFELIRWHTGVNADFPEGFKVNNTFTPDYARKFMKVHPEYDGYFRIRVQERSNRNK